MLEGFAGLVGDLGLDSQDWLTPQMVLAPSAAIPDPGPGVSTRVVADEATYAEFIGVFAAGGGTDEVSRRVFPRTFVADPGVVCITAMLDGRAVGTSVAIRTGDVAGVYAVGTLRDARRRGVGTAATWAAVSAGRAWGCETVVLQSSAMGLRRLRGDGLPDRGPLRDLRAPLSAAATGSQPGRCPLGGVRRARPGVHSPSSRRPRAGLLVSCPDRGTSDAPPHRPAVRTHAGRSRRPRGAGHLCLVWLSPPGRRPCRRRGVVPLQPARWSRRPRLPGRLRRRRPRRGRPREPRPRLIAGPGSSRGRCAAPLSSPARPRRRSGSRRPGSRRSPVRRPPRPSPGAGRGAA